MNKDSMCAAYCRAESRALGIALTVSVALAGVIACAPAAKDKTGVAGSAGGYHAVASSVTGATDAAADAATAAPAAAGGTVGPQAPAVLFIGTSLTAGYGLEPDQAFPVLVQRKADSAGTPIRAINAGVSGETSAGALHRIDWALRSPADVVVIETGANDALRALPVAAARANIAAILERVKALKPNARVFLVQMEAPPNLGNAYTAAFHGMYGDLAREKGVTLIPFLLQGVAGNPALNQGDGVHPNAKGERIVAETVWTALEPALAGVGGAAGVGGSSARGE